MYYIVCLITGDDDDTISFDPLCMIQDLDKNHIKDVLIKLNVQIYNFKSSKWNYNEDTGACYDKDNEYNSFYTKYQNLINNMTTNDIEEYFNKLPFNIVVEIVDSKDKVNQVLRYGHVGPIQIFPIKSM